MITPIPEASLNRYKISSNVTLDKYTGLSGLELLSSVAVNKLKDEYRELWTSEFSKRLATLLESLWLGNGWGNYKDDSPIGKIRSYWKETKEILLGGGILSGDDGIQIIEQTNKLLTKWGFNKSVILAPTAQNMAIDGLLKSCNIKTLAVDFGHTFVKCSYINKNGTKIDLNPFEIKLNSQNIKNDILYAKSVLKNVNESLIYMNHQLNGYEVDYLKISIAAYIDSGYFIENFRGAYCQLIKINKNAQNMFSTIWENISNKKTKTTVLHDGNSAALLLKNRPGAIIVLGTSLGYGFA